MQYLSPFPGFSKNLILRRREVELCHALRHNAPAGKVAKAAARVKVAKLHLLKALRSAATERRLTNPAAASELANVQRESELWDRMSTDEIVALYRPAPTPTP